MAGEEAALIALDAIQEGLTLHYEALCHLQRIQITKADLEGMTRRLDDLVDTLTPSAPRVIPRRAWWLTPGLCTLALLIGIVFGWESMRWRPVQELVFPPRTTQGAISTQKGRK